MSYIKAGQVCAVSAFTLAALVSGASAASSGPDDTYANQRPYGNPQDTSVRTPPKGYSLFFIETIGRHGSRSLTSESTESSVLSVWNAAEKKKALTDVGSTLSRDIKSFQSAERKIGYGKLSGLGRDEMKGIGRRTGDNYSSFFSSIKKKKYKIATVTTSVTRTKQSASALSAGLKALLGKLDGILSTPTEWSGLQIANSASSAGKAATEKVLNSTSVRDHAKHMLAASYKRSFVDSLKHPVDAALDLYLLYSTAPGMQKETSVTFARYVPKDDREAMSYATDARTFYKYGPGVKGETNTFKDARPLLADFFDRLDRRIAGGSIAAVFRVGHGETTMPFGALIKAPRSEKQVPKGEVFSRKTNPWRGSVAGRPGGNVEWTAFRDKNGKVLVTMRYNEKPVPFHSGCTPYQKDSYFYRVSELKKCLG